MYNRDMIRAQMSDVDKQIQIAESTLAFLKSQKTSLEIQLQAAELQEKYFQTLDPTGNVRQMFEMMKNASTNLPTVDQWVKNLGLNKKN